MILSKKQRALYESDRAAFYASLPPRKPRKSRAKKAKVPHWLRRKKRSPAEFTRIYGSVERVRWVELQSCVHCHVEGFSVNAHVGIEGKGGSRKANADQITSLCCSRIGVKGCHEQFDDHDAPFDNEVARAVIITHAAITEQRWRERRGLE